MKEHSIIDSVLWTDLYKLTMGQLVLENFSNVNAKYEFINRGKTSFPIGFATNLKEQVELMSEVRLTDQESEYLSSRCPYLDSNYLSWFKDFQFNPNEVEISQNNGDLKIDIEGPWSRTIYWEVPLMTTISQLYYETSNQLPAANYRDLAFKKGQILKENSVKFLDFGTRRAFSTIVHKEVLASLIKSAGKVENGGVLLGTSNVALAKEFDLNPSGTFAHEWVMGNAAIFGVKQANEKALEFWSRKYLGKTGEVAYPKLGTALTDTYTTEVFLRTFNKDWAKYFTNLRQDSGDPIEVGEKLIRHLEKIGIDPKTKGLVFSDSLDVSKAPRLNRHFDGRINTLFGIGTHLTNDVGVKPLNIVIKLFGINTGSEWIPTVKLSDDLGKISGDQSKLKEILSELDLSISKAA